MLLPSLNSHSCGRGAGSTRHPEAVCGRRNAECLPLNRRSFCQTRGGVIFQLKGKRYFCRSYENESNQYTYGPIKSHFESSLIPKRVSDPLWNFGAHSNQENLRNLPQVTSNPNKDVLKTIQESYRF